jgi:hypothetical protein
MQSLCLTTCPVVKSSYSHLVQYTDKLPTRIPCADSRCDPLNGRSVLFNSFIFKGLRRKPQNISSREGSLSIGRTNHMVLSRYWPSSSYLFLAWWLVCVPPVLMLQSLRTYGTWNQSVGLPNRNTFVMCEVLLESYVCV